MTVVARSLRNLQVEIQASNHLLLADEPLDEGGEDLGPAPYDLLLSALAACKVMTVQLYARRKGWPLEAVHVRLNHRTVSGADCDDCKSGPEAKVEIIDVELDFEGPLDETQLTRLLEISDRCPVHRTLEREIKIRGALASGLGALPAAPALA